MAQKKKTIFDKILNPPFETYWTKDKVQAGLKRGELIQGKLRINKKKYEEAFVDDPAGGPDFFISGLLSRNRALHDDDVVVQVLPQEKWITLDSKPSPKKNCVQDVARPSQEAPRKEVSSDPMLRETLIDKLYSSVSSVSFADTVKSADPIPENICRTAKVVYIVERVHNRTSAGYLKAYDKVKQLALFSPRDNRVPRVFVHLSDCPEDFSTNLKKYETSLFVCYIEDWPEHSPVPHGKLMRSLGEAGQVECESESFLIENEVDYSEFSQEILDCLPKQSPWTIPQEEIDRRRDFRKECVFTIDPDTAKDLDDALHLKKLENDSYEVGVHIADVSHFVKPGTALDVLASKRATSVYLVQKVIPMLPRLLCEQLCSLNPDKERLTFSVVWTLTSKGEFISEWYGKSLICSCSKLSYDHAQLMIEGETNHPSFPPVYGGHSTSEVAEAVTALNMLATAIRAQRQSKGTLRLDQFYVTLMFNIESIGQQLKLKYSIDPSTGLPNGCQVYKLKESNRLIEEFMLMANMAVARKCHQAFPEVALLRRHPTPKRKSAEALVSKMTEMGVQLDVSTAGTLQTSLDNYSGRTPDLIATEMEKSILVSHCSKIMELAKYFCTGSTQVEKYHHYALNVPFYTHFTSPIRRYADIVVHRQLAAALGEATPFEQSGDEEQEQALHCNKKKKAAKTEVVSFLKGEATPFEQSGDEVQEQALHCNKKKKAAKTVEELSSDLFLSILIKECGPFQAKGMVTAVLDKSFDVFVEEFGIVKRVYCEKLPLRKFSFNSRGQEHGSQLTLEWASEDDTSVIQVLKLFSMVDVSVQTGSTTALQYEVVVYPTELASSKKTEK